VTDLSLEDILELERTEKPQLEPYKPPEQIGPIRRHGQEKRCVSKRCGSSTYYTFRRIPYCYPHLIERVTELLVGLGITE
jgi:hypothetical protein